MSSKRKSVDLEQYYTNPNIAKQCIETISGKLKDKRVIEPSAGNGSFSTLIKCEAYDLDPKLDSIIKADFLEQEFDANPAETVIIGNPPFGRQSKLAFDFMKKSMKMADTVAFILPKSFSKPSYQNRLPTTHILEYSWDIPNNSFIYNGKEYDVSCVWQVWVKGERKKINTKTESSHFEFTTKDSANIAIRRVGAYAGKVFREFDKLSTNSNYFIKCDEKDVPLFERIEYNLNKKHLNSISKHLVITNFEKLK